MKRLAIIGALAAASFAVAAPAAAKPAPKPPPFKVKMKFTQTRDWTHYYQQVGTECSLTNQGNGSDVATLTANAIFNLQQGRRGFAGLTAAGTHSRVGTMTHVTGTPNFPGADCGGPQTTTTDPVTGCGPKPAFLSSGALNYVGRTMLFQWESSSAPDFDCPYFGGANDAVFPNALPSDVYRDVEATGVTRTDLLKATKRRPAVATGSDTITGVETCATLSQGCAEGVTYNATGTVNAEVKFTFTPKKR